MGWGVCGSRAFQRLDDRSDGRESAIASRLGFCRLEYAVQDFEEVVGHPASGADRLGVTTPQSPASVNEGNTTTTPTQISEEANFQVRIFRSARGFSSGNYGAAIRCGASVLIWLDAANRAGNHVWHLRSGHRHIRWNYSERVAV